MKKILEELWYGNICPNENTPVKSKELSELRKFIAEHHDTLHASLNESQKNLLEKFDDCFAELTSITERDIFVYAFCLGAKIAIEVMCFDF